MQTAVFLLSLHQVEDRTALKKSKIYGLLKEGQFPQPVRLGRRSVRWRSDHIDEFINGLKNISQDEVAA